MNNKELKLLAAHIVDELYINTRWLKLTQAAKYSNIGRKRLKTLAVKGKIVGYKDPDSKRQDWIFDKKSIDSYRSAPTKQIKSDALKILDTMKARA